VNISSNIPERLPSTKPVQSSPPPTKPVESAPAEVSQYEKIVELLTTLFPVWVS
jgi:bile acid:Na+ symporter, BASS family